MQDVVRAISLGFVFASVAVLQACGGGALPQNTNTTCVAPAQVVQDELNTQLVAAFPQLPALSTLVELIQAPGSDRWYAVTQTGRIYWFENSASASRLNLLMDLSSVVQYSGEMGLLGLAFHPDFVNNRQLFVSYNDSRQNGRSTISRFVANGTNTIDISTERMILTVNQPAANHNGGHIAFGPDGMLYIGFGDGGGSGDPYGNGQNMGTLLGKLLRINVTNTTTYSIPADNPFVGNASIRPEIYASGLRNPWRFSFDKQTGQMWLADVGQNKLEEVDIIVKGGNYGWPIMEGTECYKPANCNRSGLQLPVVEYNHDGGDCSVSGGFVYRGTQSTALAGRYLYSDFCTGRVRASVLDTSQEYVTQELLLSGMNHSGFAQDQQGEVYALNYSGGRGEGIYRVSTVNNGSTSTIPERLSDSGCYDNTAQKTMSKGVAPYEGRAALWSDGAKKSRYLAIPKGTKIDVLDDGDFEFPVGTVLIKNFMSGERYLETRLFMRHQTGWGGYSYEWLDDQSDALLVEGGNTIDAGDFVHTIPTRGQCFECHSSASRVSLGVEASQLNFTYTYPSKKAELQNAALYKAGYLKINPEARHMTAMADINDQSATLATRARSYLHANCSGCHRPGGPMARIDLRVQTPLAQTGTCNATPTAGNMGIPDARLLVPGDATRSLVLQRMLNTGEFRMPPLGTHVVDEVATGVIGAWIEGLEGCL